MNQNCETVTEAEREKLCSAWMSYLYGANPDVEQVEQSREEISEAYIGKFPQFVSQCPGYVGPVYFVVFSGSPSFYSVATEEADGTFRFFPSELNDQEAK